MLIISIDGHNNNYDRHKATSEICDTENPKLISIALRNFYTGEPIFP